MILVRFVRNNFLQSSQSYLLATVFLCVKTILYILKLSKHAIVAFKSKGINVD